jgi:hypothetical protein
MSHVYWIRFAPIHVTKVDVIHAFDYYFGVRFVDTVTRYITFRGDDMYQSYAVSMNPDQVDELWKNEAFHSHFLEPFRLKIGRCWCQIQIVPNDFNFV